MSDAANATLDYETPSAQPKNKAWVYAGRTIVFICVAGLAVVVFVVLYFAAFALSLGRGPLGD